MQKITLVINDPPVAQPRPRITRWGNFDPAKDKKNWARLQVVDSCPEHPLECPIELNIIFNMDIPKTTSKKKRVMMLSNELKHVKRPDLDNLLKFTLDTLNCLLYKDDSQIHKINVFKQYSEHANTVIEAIF